MEAENMKATRRGEREREEKKQVHSRDENESRNGRTRAKSIVEKCHVRVRAGSCRSSARETDDLCASRFRMGKRGF